MNLRILTAALLAVAYVFLTGCGDTYKKNGGLPGAIDAGVQSQSNSKARRYEDAEVNFERPAMWNVAHNDTKDENVYALDISSPDSLYARLTLVRQSGDPGAFPFEIVQSMRRTNPSVAADPLTAPLAGREARGYKYRMKADGIDWEGWVVSFTQGRSEICFLGQFPASASEARGKELTELMNGMHLKNVPKKTSESKP